MYVAYDTLPNNLMQSVLGLTIKHETEFTLDGLSRSGGRSLADVKAAGDFDVSKLPGVDHPIVRTHPETNRKALYIGHRQNTYVNGQSVEESENLLDAVWAHVQERDRATWHNRWKVGDLLICDRRSSGRPSGRRIPGDPRPRRPGP